MFSNFNFRFFVSSSIFILLPYSFLAYALFVNRDSGVFMYSGMIINDGGAPYLDSWDHKGPILYLLNAVGFYLFGSAHGVIFLEGLLLFLSCAISMHLWSRFLPDKIVIIGVFLFITTFYATFEGGNLSESWLVPFLLLTYSLAFIYFKNESESRESFVPIDGIIVAIGISLAVALLTRPNNGFGLITLGALLILKERRFRLVLIGAISFLAVFLPVIVWLNSKGALDGFYQQYLVYNFSYAKSSGIYGRITSAYSLLGALFYSPLGLAALVLSIYAIVSTREPLLNEKRRWLACLYLSLVFIADIASALVSGRGYLHYISLSSAAFLVLFLACLSAININFDNLFKAKNNLLFVGYIILVLGISMVRPINAVFLSPLKNGITLSGNENYKLVTYLVEKSSRSDFVLVHGAESWLLVAANRRSPTSITYYYPAIQDFRDTVEQYEREVLENPPLYIIEAPSSCGLSRGFCNSDLVEFKNLKSLLAQNYSFEVEINQFLFWRRSN